MYNTLFTRVSLAAVIAVLAGCSSTPPPPKPAPDYSFKTAAKKFIAADSTRNNGVVVDKGLFYPKETFSYSYRYCSTSEQQAQQDIAQFDQLATKTCTANNGSMVNLDTGTWCVQHPNTDQETPLFASRISSIDLWADICSGGPFVTMRIIENRDIPQTAWIDGAKLLGYQPYSTHRTLMSSKAIKHLDDETPPPAEEPWTEETAFIASHVGETVCMYKKSKDDAYGVTYKGTIESIKDGRVRVLATRKIKGDVRIAPVSTPLPWHKKAIIEADAKSWFICK
ncbi:hypothetical protein [Photobacterium phosphoreum]|uniref:hypothetical protein n=1 Tax=Photobacterium phosphoreum TaxID=659 RepID=UPI0007F8B7D9|nr:hypothetical protein [Photobacterium phosphoreum]OBU33515.1 hypothetical protein AYY24_05320 [Photobacterium phosphoreum]PSW36347.1 hypothetical protein CTM87_13520 [Photobacterium phosphoreum]